MSYCSDKWLILLNKASWVPNHSISKWKSDSYVRVAMLLLCFPVAVEWKSFFGPNTVMCDFTIWSESLISHLDWQVRFGVISISWPWAWFIVRFWIIFTYSFATDLSPLNIISFTRDLKVVCLILFPNFSGIFFCILNCPF